MKVIVIIVAYNGIKWYKSCFDSLRNSTISLETIVIDNKSTDNTVQFIKDNYPEIHLIESNTNLGFGKANNIGFEYAITQNADYIFLLNQDAWVRPNAIETLIMKMEESPEFGILSPIHLNGTQTELDFGFRYYILPDSCPNLISDYIVNGNADNRIYATKFVNAALWLISKECLNTIGGFLPLFPHYGEDINYASRVEYHGYKIGVYPYSWGIHDRTIKNKENISFKKARNSELIDSLIILTNIHESLFACICRNYLNLALIALRNLFNLSFNKLLINICTSMNVLYLLSRIYKERNLSKKRGLNFLYKNTL